MALVKTDIRVQEGLRLMARLGMLKAPLRKTGDWRVTEFGAKLSDEYERGNVYATHLIDVLMLAGFDEAREPAKRLCEEWGFTYSGE